MLEKEIKILDINSKDIQKKLEKMWAEKTFEGYIHDIYYDFPGDSWDKMDINERIFRIRKKWDTYLYTIKRKRSKNENSDEKSLKIADEWERNITNVESFKKVLEKYWMVKTREKKKHRISYSLENIEFDIDDYFYKEKEKPIPTLLEIEGENYENINEYIEKLWLSENEKKNRWSRKLFEHYDVAYSYF